MTARLRPPITESLSESRAGRGAKSKVVLLDLTGKEKEAGEWLLTHLPGAEPSFIRKSDLKWRSKREAMAAVRKLKPDIFAVFTGDLRHQTSLLAMSLFGIGAGARKILLGDRDGRLRADSRLTVLLVRFPRLITEFVLGYALLAPLSLIATEALNAALRVRAMTRAKPDAASKALRRPRTALYIRALPVVSQSAATAQGGMATHVSGFARGAAAEGHRLKFLVCGLPGFQTGPHEWISIKPSAFFSVSRTFYELWNNLSFTIQALRAVRDRGLVDDVDFVYQRYSRFNWTGVVLSIATGLPLLLEFNGSEVWVSKHWDPIGQIWLLRRFEQLNLRAADIVFTVSEAERRSLEQRETTKSEIIVNPNGVDPGVFRPGCGGLAVRRLLGITDEVVIGFTGTFGPWHGTEMLARAAHKLTESRRWRLLFVGEGDARPRTEEIARRAGKHVTCSFFGRVTHQEIPAYLEACDILVSPHVPLPGGIEFFGSPTKLFEYMAAGKPIVASKLGQIADAITHGENGILVEPADPDALARAIELLAANKQLAERLAASARRTAIERFTWNQNAARVFDAFDEYIQRGAA